MGRRHRDRTARVEREREDYAAAVPNIREAIARFQALDPDHPAIGPSLHALAQNFRYIVVHTFPRFGGGA